MTLLPSRITIVMACTVCIFLSTPAAVQSHHPWPRPRKFVRWRVVHVHCTCSLSYRNIYNSVRMNLQLVVILSVEMVEAVQILTPVCVLNSGLDIAVNSVSS